MRKSTRATKAKTKKSTRKVGKVGRPAVAGLAKTKKFAGKTYTKTACSTSVTEARKKAEAARKTGTNARVVKNPKGGACVYTRAGK